MTTHTSIPGFASQIDCIVLDVFLYLVSYFFWGIFRSHFLTFFMETTLVVEVVIQFHVLKVFDSFPRDCLLLYLIWKSVGWLSRRGMQPTMISDASNTTSGCFCNRLYSFKPLYRVAGGRPSVWNSHVTSWPSGTVF